MVGAAAMIGASMQAPLAGLALVLELTHSGFQIVVPIPCRGPGLSLGHREGVMAHAR